MSKYGVLSGPYFPVFGLNTEIFFVNLCIQSEYGKYGPEKTLYLDNFHTVTALAIDNFFANSIVNNKAQRGTDVSIHFQFFLHSNFGIQKESNKEEHLFRSDLSF